MSRLELVTPCVECGHKGCAHLEGACREVLCSCDEDMSRERYGERVHRSWPDEEYEGWTCQLTVCPCTIYVGPWDVAEPEAVPVEPAERVELLDGLVPNAVRAMVKGAQPHGWEVVALWHAQGHGHTSVAVRLRAQGSSGAYRYAIATWWDGKFGSAYWSAGGAGGRLNSTGLRAWLREGRTDGDGGRRT